MNLREIGFQLSDIKAGSELGILGLLRNNRISLIHAFIPPRPSALLRVAPSEHCDPVFVVSNGVDAMTVVRQRARRPRLARIKIRIAFC